MKRLKQHIIQFLLIVSVLTLVSCNLDDLGLNISPPKYAVSGSVENLQGSELRLMLHELDENDELLNTEEAGEEISINGEAVFEFDTDFPSGTRFLVELTSNPQAPAQDCLFTETDAKSYIATMGSGEHDGIALQCTIENYSIAGLVNGLSSGRAAADQLQLELNGEETVTVPAYGRISFSTTILDGERFSVQVKRQPSNPTQTCTAYSNSGTLASRAFDDVKITCSDTAWNVAGFTVGLEGSGLRLSNNNSDELDVNKSGFFRFDQRIADGAQANVQVVEQPTAPVQVCSTDNVPDTVRGYNKVDVFVVCSTAAYSVSGTVTGLAGRGLVVQVNGGDDTQVISDGIFQFAGARADGSGYQVRILQQPVDPDQDCVVSNGAGTITSADVDNVRIECDTNHFTVGGFVSGLTGSGLVLRNGDDQLDIATGGVFTMDERFISGSSYNIEVAHQPTSPRQICNVVSGVGNVDDQPVKSVFVKCLDAYTVGVQVANLRGDSLVLENIVNGARVLVDQPIPDSPWPDVPSEFALGIPIGGAFDLEIVSAPSSISQNCTFDTPSDAQRSNITQNYTTIAISCVTDFFTIGGTVAGLSSGSIGLRLTGPVGTADVTVNSGTTDFTFGAMPIEDGNGWTVSIDEPMLGFDCILENNTGTLDGSDVTGVGVDCTEDTGPPEVLSLTSPTAPGTYNEGQVILVEVNTNKVMIVDEGGGTPSLLLNSGGTADYVSGSGSGVLVFSYTIQAGDDASSFDVTGAGALSLNGGTIRTIGGDDLVTTLPLPGSGNQLGDASLVVDAFAAAPAAPVLSAGFDTGASDSDGITNQNTITFSGTIEPGATLEILEGGSVIDTLVADGAGDFSHPVTLGPPDGAFVLSFRQEDVYGNRSADSSDLNITLDTAAPAPGQPDLAAGDDSGSSSSDNITNVDSGLTFTGTGEIGATLELLINGLVLDTVTVDGGGNWTATGAAPTGFTHNVAARQIDIAGNVSVSSTILPVTVDTDAPVLNPVSISATGSDSAVAFIGEDVNVAFTSNENVTIAGATILGEVAVVGGGPTGWTASYTAQITDTLGIVPFLISGITDTAGNTASNVSATTDASTVSRSNNPLLITDAEFLDVDYNGRLDHVKLVFDAAVDDSSFPGYGGTNSEGITTSDWLVAGYSNVRLDTTNGRFAVYNAAEDVDDDDTIYLAFDESVSFDLNDTPEVTSTITPALRSLATGIIASQINVGDVTEIDRARPLPPTAPDLPSGSDSGISNSDDLTNVTSTITFTGTDEAGATVELLEAGAPENSDVAGGGGAWSIGIMLDGGDGTYPLTLRQTDVAGNTSDESTQLNVELDASISTPTIPDLAAADDSGSSDSDDITRFVSGLDFSGTADAGDTLELLVDGGVEDTVTVDGLGDWAAVAAETNGTYTITARASDDAGNTVTSAGLTLTIDSDAPVLTPIHMESNNAITTIALTGDDVTLDFTSDEPLVGTPTVSILGQGVVPTGGPTVWQAVYTIQGGDANGAIAISITAVTDTAGNTSSTSATTDASFVNRASPPIINAAETMDVDGNGFIDHYKLTFDQAVDDSTFPGYGGTNSEGSTTAFWSVSGYANVRIDTTNGRFTGVYNAANDVDDDEVIYLAFDEGSIDTAATPDLTTSGVDGINSLLGAELAQINTVTVSEADRAPPVQIRAAGDNIVNAWQIKMEFSEAIDDSAGLGCSGVFVAGDFDYTDLSASGTSDVRGNFLDNDGCDTAGGGYYLHARVDKRFTLDDIGADTVGFSTTIYDASGNGNASVDTEISFEAALELYYPMDSSMGDTDSVVTDVSGNGRDGTVVAGASLTQDMSNINNQAYALDGSASPIVATGYKGVLGTQARTVSMWVRSELGGNLFFWGVFSGTAGARWFLSIRSNSVGGQIGSPAVDIISGNKAADQSIVGVGWQHVAATFNPGSDVTDVDIYINGRLAGTSGQSAQALNTISAFDVTIGNVLAGEIDEARVYSRALSANEIKQLAVKVPDGMVAHFPLDSNADDLTGNGRDGTAFGNAAATATDRYGQAGGAFAFDGTGDWITATIPELPQGASDRTLCAWANHPTGSPTGNSDVVFAYGSNTTDQRVDLRIPSTLWAFDSSGGQTVGGAIETKWTHMCIRYNGGNKRIYRDGVLRNTAARTLNTVGTTFVIGNRQDLPTNFTWFGDIQDVRIYNRRLTNNEIRALSIELERGLVTYYPLNDNTTSTAAGAIKDYSGNNYHLTLSGDPVPVADRNGYNTSAYSFSGGGQLSRNGTMSNLPIDMQERTACAWALFDSTAGGTVFDYGDNPRLNDRQYRIKVNNTVGLLSNFRTAASEASWLGVTTATWMYACGQFNGSTNILFVDGTARDTQGYGTGDTDNTSFNIGSRPDGAGDFLSGTVDDVRVYNRVLLDNEMNELSQ